MANLQRKPALHLSVAPSAASAAAQYASSPAASTSSRRIASWGSATSETWHNVSAMGDQHMTPLPSPLEGREWGFLPAAGGSWQGAWTGGSLGTGGRSRGNSLLQEQHDAAALPTWSRGSERSDNWLNASTSTSTAGGVDEFGVVSPAASGRSDESSAASDRKAPERSKTLSFFGSADESRALSPPPNPPSRNNSLNQRNTPARAPPFPNLPSPGWEPHQQDLLRSSVASSSGGSWLDDAAEGGSFWRRDRGTSISSATSHDGASWQGSLSRTPRTVSPARTAVGTAGNESAATGSPVAALRPRLAALNTSSTMPSGSGFPGPAESSPVPHKPLTSLPSAVDVPSRPRFLDFGAPSSSSSSRSSTIRQFVSLGDEPTPASSALPSRAATPAHSISSPPSSSQQQGGASASLDPTASPREVDEPPVAKGDVIGDYAVDRVLGKGAFSRVALAHLVKGKERAVNGRDRGHARTASRDAGADGGLVALKLMSRKTCEANDRMRISVMREAEVLKTIHHPSLVSLYSSFKTPIYTVLVLDYCEGGELFDFLADWHPQVSEGLARRMFGELASAVGWMHEIGLVHRDIKLENILLTSRPFPCSDPTNVLATLPSPFLKLTDFGLSRFIDPASPLLATRCGSEAYAAPELIMGKKYDGRQTDAWALGVVLYAIITGVMPFVEPVDGSARGRKAYLLKIAKADYRWPGQLSRAPSLSNPSPVRSAHPTHASSASEPGFATGAATALLSPPPPSARLVTPAVQALVARLLVRDPSKRAAAADVWESEWMQQGEGRPPRIRGNVRAPPAADAMRRGSEFLLDDN
ncbi:uncharacterized protein JCM10292_006867 [Rhodotorula paludigena]|uniref:uncharacterized protein n=1 Tax=Rhodotorula paludigena TaxID=86838 RepID=UPI00316DBF18